MDMIRKPQYKYNYTKVYCSLEGAVSNLQQGHHPHP